MPNTVYSYSPTTWADHFTLGNQTRMNNLETQASVALHGLNPNLSGPFVVSGIACTKDGTVANQLDIASGYAFITMSDGSTGSVSVVADNTHTTSTPSSTYYLFLKNDGTWQWGTTSTGPTNSLPICQATTDGSGNISTVTDVRHTAGSPGIPLVVARVNNQHVTSTTLQTLATFTTPAHGLYQLSGSFIFINGGNGTITFRASYTDPITGGAPHALLEAQQGFLNALTFTTSAGVNVPCYPVGFYAKGSTNITIEFQDSTNTPGSWVSAALTRLS